MLFYEVLCLTRPHRARLVELRHLVVSDLISLSFVAKGQFLSLSLRFTFHLFSTSFSHISSVFVQTLRSQAVGSCVGDL